MGGGGGGGGGLLVAFTIPVNPTGMFVCLFVFLPSQPNYLNVLWKRD